MSLRSHYKPFLMKRDTSLLYMFHILDQYLGIRCDSSSASRLRPSRAPRSLSLALGSRTAQDNSCLGWLDPKTDTDLVPSFYRLIGSLIGLSDPVSVSLARRRIGVWRIDGPVHCATSGC
jgi:hypothetical protein